MQNVNWDEVNRRVETMPLPKWDAVARFFFADEVVYEATGNIWYSRNRLTL